MDRFDFIGACSEGGPAFDRVLRRLVTECWAPLMREAARDLGQHESARDLVQETLIKAWQRCKQFRGDSELMAWLRGILRHAILDSLRSRHNEVPLLDDDGQVAAGVEDALRAATVGEPFDPAAFAANAQAMALYARCMARFMTAHPGEALVLRWIVEDDLTIEQLADILRRSPGATREFLSQCRKKVRPYLAPWYALVRDGR